MSTPPRRRRASSPPGRRTRTITPKELHQVRQEATAAWPQIKAILAHGLQTGSLASQLEVIDRFMRLMTLGLPREVPPQQGLVINLTLSDGAPLTIPVGQARKGLVAGDDGQSAAGGLKSCRG